MRKRLFTTQNLTLGSILFALLFHFVFSIERTWDGRENYLEEVERIAENPGKALYTERPEDKLRIVIPGKNFGYTPREKKSPASK